MNELLKHASDEDLSQIISRSASEHLSISLRREELNEAPASGTITIETPLMIAAENGVVEMVDKILELFPSRIKDVNLEGKNTILLATEYRQTEVFKFLCEQEWLTESLFRQVDKEGNNVLHLAARLGVEHDLLNCKEAPSMSRENSWFEFVEDSMPDVLLESYNKKRETPYDIFRENHKELVKSEREWVAKTSQACSMISTIVFTVAFATRTNVPGGYDSKGGYAVLGRKDAFQNFVSSSFVAFASSLISTICFLSVIASPSPSFPCLGYVPFKFYIGVYLMFASIIFLWISFCAGDVFIDNDQSRFYVISSLLIIIFVVTQLLALLVPPMSRFWSIPTPRRVVTPPIGYRRTNNEENGTDLNNQN